MSRLVKGPVVLVVLDGWGLREDATHNGIALAKTPIFDKLRHSFPFTQLHASGEHVGLPAGQMGSSEVGHTTIGAGRVLYQDLVKIGKAVESNSLVSNPAVQQAANHVKARGSQLHILGLLSPGGVHSHEDHIYGLVQAAKQMGVDRVVIHAFLDGRDMPKDAGVKSLQKLEDFVAKVGGTSLGSVMGRFYAMDRDTNWDRTQKAFAAIFNGQADHIYETSVKPSQIIGEWYHQQTFDEFLEPMLFKTPAGNVLEVKDGDAIVFANFRKDRAKQLSIKIGEAVEDKDLVFVTMTDYGKEVKALVAFSPETNDNTLGSVISAAGLTQAHIAETEKFPHATLYLNGRQEPFANEDDVLIPSFKVKSHDEKPEMRAAEITAATLERLPKNDFIFINYANPDMIGHTANEAAIIKAVEIVDANLGKVVDAVQALDGALVIIADHGNAEYTVDPETGAPHTSHTTSPVPCIVVSKLATSKLMNGGGLQDVAPTVLELLGLDKPDNMTGRSLIIS